VLDAALELIDKAGIDRLTVRGLAQELGRAPMTLYVHFESKDELLDLALEHLTLRLLKPHRHSTWQRELEAGARHIRRELLEHPHWVALLTRIALPRSALGVCEHLAGLMLEDGLGREVVLFALSSILSHALGSVLTERLMGGAPSVPERKLALVKGMLATEPRSTYPALTAVSSAFDLWSFDRVFDVGLQSLIGGLAELPRRGHDGHAGNRPHSHRASTVKA
jgi:AcrR family transcriptional regulator